MFINVYLFPIFLITVLIAIIAADCCESMLLTIVSLGHIQAAKVQKNDDLQSFSLKYCECAGSEIQTIIAK
jgi:hypothetical protein